MYEQIGKLVCRSAEETRQVCESTDWLARSDLQFVSDQEAADQLGRLFGLRLDPELLWHAVSNIFWRNEPIEPIIRHVSRLGLPLVLVSNTCSAHIRWLMGRFEVLDYFPHKILSYEVQAAKPSPEIFAAASRAAGCRPEECFFTDDTLGHIEGARKLGFDAVVFQTVAQLARELKMRGIELPVAGAI
jgi:FMN phosphatase YigB (HAD superfamily)